MPDNERQSQLHRYRRSLASASTHSMLKLVMPQTRTGRASYKHDRDDDMKVDSPSEDKLGRRSMIDKHEEAVGDDEDADLRVGAGDRSDDDDDDDDNDDNDGECSEPPYKRICRGRASALSLALKDVSRTISFTKPVLVRVGHPDTHQDFHIHYSRLVDSSPYFESAFEALRQDPNEDDEVLNLPDDDPAIFQLYAHYIYNPSSIQDLSLSPTSGDYNLNTSARSTEVFESYIDLLNAYIFGEKIQNSGFQNEVMNRILRSMKEMHRQKSISSSEQIVRPLIELLYPSLPPDSIGRGLVVETFIVLWSHSDMLQTFIPDLSRELLTEIAEMLLSGDKDHIRDAWAQAINGDYSYYHAARSDEH